MSFPLFGFDPVMLSTGAAIGAGGALLLGLGIYRLTAHSRLKRLETEHKRNLKNLTLLQSAVNAGGEAILLWPAGSDDELASSQLHDILAIPAMVRKVGLVDVLNLFDGSARTELDLATSGLRRNGENFRFTLPSQRLKRTFSIEGTRLQTEKGAFLGDVMRIRDRTDELNEINKLSFEAKNLNSESRRLRDLLESLPIPVWQRAQDLNITYANKAYKQAAEGDPVTAGGKKFELGAGSFGADGRSLAQKVATQKKPAAERHHIVVQGSRRLMEFHEIPLLGNVEGTIQGLAGCALDYSPVDEAKKELLRQEKVQDELLESLEAAIVIFGKDKRLKFFNTSFAELMKLEATWLNTKPDLGELIEAFRERRLLPEVTDFPAYKRGWTDMFTTLLEPRDELLHLPDGRAMRMLATPHPQGGLIFVFDDVTDRIRLQESHSILSAVQKETIDNLYEAVAVFGEDGKLKLFNPPYTMLWNLDPAKLQDEPHIGDVAEMTKGFFQETQWAEYKNKMLQQWSGRAQEAGRIERKDGSIMDYAVVPLPDGGALFSYVDVSDTVKVEKALRERAEALEAADQLKSEFIANVSYGLRAPLTSIIGFGEILNNDYFGKLNEKQREYSSGILDASQKLLALINDILDLASIEAGYMTLQYTTFDVHSMLASIMNLVRDRAANSGLTIDFECPLEIGSVSADERRLRQVMFNLISNAINFTPSGGRILLQGTKQGSDIVITVSDNGQGIPMEDQARVFNKFERGNTKKAGAGLGLSLVRSIIELHGGKVDLQSTPGKGTVITCRIPAKPRKEKEAA